MVNSFRNFLVEEEKTVFFTFGRMNPPTVGHGKLMDTLASKSGNSPYRIFVSQSNDPKKNPLDYTSKVKFIRKMFPNHARSVMLNRKVKSVFDVAVTLYNEGFKNIAMVVGSDRVTEFQTLLNKYNGVDARHGHYNFKKITIISAGERDPDAEGVEGMSASKMRGFALDNDFASFSQGLPKRVSNADAKALFNTVRKGMGLKEEKNFKKHIELFPVSETRELFVRGSLFSEGDQVVIKSTEEVATVTVRGTNYLVLETFEGKKVRKWLDDVELLESNHRLDPNLPLKHQLKHSKMYVDKDVDGDVDKFDKNTPDEITGVPDQTKKILKKNKGEKQHTKKGMAYEKIEVAQDKDIDDRKGSQPATFQKGIKSKSTKAARDAHFKKMAKRTDHKNPDLYKDAPGDKKAREKGTKESPYTKRFRDMHGEESDPVAVAKKRIDREKKSDAARHDRMLDRATVRAAKMKAKETKV